MADRADLTVPQFPTMPDATKLVAMRVSSDPERFVYGDADTLDWLRNRLASDEDRCPTCGKRSWNPPDDVYCVDCATEGHERDDARHNAALDEGGRWACGLCWQTLKGEGDRCNSGLHQGPDDPNGWRGRAVWTHDAPPPYERALTRRASRDAGSSESVICPVCEGNGFEPDYPDRDCRMSSAPVGCNRAKPLTTPARTAAMTPAGTPHAPDSSARTGASARRSPSSPLLTRTTMPAEPFDA